MMNDYFPSLKELSETTGLVVDLSLIKGEKSWKKLIV